MSMTLETVTPDMAKAWLSRSKKNFRPLDEKHARRIASDIVAGSYTVNGESIKVDNNDTVLDGQHRLRAVVIANTSIRTWVFRGLVDDVTIDTGKKRSLSQYLKNTGLLYPQELAASLQWMYRWEKDSVESLHLTASFSECIAILERHPDLADSMRAAGRARLVISPSVLGFVYCIGYRQDQFRAEQFVEALHIGEDLSKDNSALLLRNRLLANKTSKAKLSTKEKMALVIRAWLLFRDRRPCGVLRWRGGDGEAFPDINEVAA